MVSLLAFLAGDVRICLRGLLRSPIVTLAIVTIVGVGIGATTAISGAVDAALLKPLPYADPARLVRVFTDAPPNRFPFSVADYRTLDAEQTQFEQIAGYASRQLTYAGGSNAERVRGRVVSWTYFGTLGIRPVIGRDFVRGDAAPGAPPAVIVSRGFWERSLGGRAAAVGEPIRLDGVDCAVVGVLPDRVGPLEQGQELFTVAQWDAPPRKGPFFITVIGRLRRDVRRTSAEAELRAINRRMFPIWRTSYQDDKASWALMDLRTFVVGDVETTAGLALCAVVLVWLIACANASSLLVARVTSRRREFAVRAALGASRSRVMGHLLVESGLLAAGASIVAVAVTSAAFVLLRNAGPAYFPRTREVAFTGTERWLFIGLMIASACLFGLVPALHGSGGPVDDSLRGVSRSATGNLAVRRTRRVLVAAQFAIATPLLVVAGLLAASLNELGRVDLGFDSANLLSGSLALPPAQYQTPARVASFWIDLQRRAQSLPGVATIAYADARPPNDVNNFNNFDLEAFPTPPGQSQPVTPWVAVSPDYFRLMGLSLLQGRLLDEHDAIPDPATPGGVRQNNVVVVDRAWAARFFPNDTAVGKRLHEGGCSTCPWTTVAGVVSDIKYAGVDKPDEGTVYVPLVPAGRARYLLVRTTIAPTEILPALRRAVHDLDPDIPIADAATIDELIARSLQRPRSLSLLVGAFAVVAVSLAGIGVYGVMAYYVQQHVREIGIRLALGGSGRRVLQLIVGQGMRIVTAGVAAGLVVAAFLARLMASLLFGVGAGSPATFGAATAVLTIVALVACLVAASPAVAVQPSSVLRQE